MPKTLRSGYHVYERTPKGAAKSYRGPGGEVLSARQYRNRLAQAKGYDSLSQQQTARKKKVTISQNGFVQHHYHLGVPRSLKPVVADVLEGYEYEDSFALVAHYVVYEEGARGTHELTLQTTLYPAVYRYIDVAVDDLRLTLGAYGAKKILWYAVTTYPAKGGL